MKSLNKHLHILFKKYWTTRTYFTVDKTIQRFIGRFKETVNIPIKLEPEKFKIWVLANSGYVLDWMYHVKRDNNRLVDLDEFWIKNWDFSKTQAVVFNLLAQHDIFNNYQYMVWLDNLFTSAQLLIELLAKRFGAAGMVRTQKIKQKKQEEIHGTKV